MKLVPSVLLQLAVKHYAVMAYTMSIQKSAMDTTSADSRVPLTVEGKCFYIASTVDNISFWVIILVTQMNFCYRHDNDNILQQQHIVSSFHHFYRRPQYVQSAIRSRSAQCDTDVRLSVCLSVCMYVSTNRYKCGTMRKFSYATVGQIEDTRAIAAVCN